MRRAAHLALPLIAALALSGCAAAALPALAGGAMLRSSGPDGEREAANTAKVSSAEAEMAVAPSQPIEPGGRKFDEAGFASFAQYARRQASSSRIDSDTLSAALLNPGMLDGERAQCNDLPPAVVIDLDRENEAFAPQDVYQTRPELAAELKVLRDSDVSIGWISATNIDHLGAVRYALAQAGLDPTGKDQLLLIQHPDERKQIRREEFSKSHCIVAIAGDTMADFDELFLFLTHPDAAKQLDALIGDGWFLTPLALTKQ